MSFDRAVEALLRDEGGYSNDPRDSGGATNWGVTEQLARAYGYTGLMKDMPRHVALAIYRQHFWDAQCLGLVDDVSPVLAEKLFNASVNMGRAPIGKFLQRMLNVLNNRQALYQDVGVDGAIGRVTVAALHAYVLRRGDEGVRVLLRGLNSLQAVFYIELAEAREKDEAFVYGWLRNRVE